MITSKHGSSTRNNNIILSIKSQAKLKGHFITLQSRLLTTLKKKAFKNIVGKGENAGNQHFLFFPQCFLTFSKRISVFQLHLFCRLQMLSISTSPKFCRLVKS